MARRVFFSFHYKRDSWRAGKVRNIGVVEGNKPVSDNDWEEVARGGEKAIKKWIDDQMKGRSCVVVLIGEKTAGRKWIEYEIEKGWNDGKGLLGIYVHKLGDATGSQDEKGKNPFEAFSVDGKKLSSIVKSYNSRYQSSKYVYDDIAQNIDDWVEEAIAIRQSV